MYKASLWDSMGVLVFSLHNLKLALLNKEISVKNKHVLYWMVHIL